MSIFHYSVKDCTDKLTQLGLTQSLLNFRHINVSSQDAEAIVIHLTGFGATQMITRSVTFPKNRIVFQVVAPCDYPDPVPVFDAIISKATRLQARCAQLLVMSSSVTRTIKTLSNNGFHM